MKKIILYIVSIIIVLSSQDLYSQEYRINRIGIKPIQYNSYGQSFGRGTTRSEAYADALRRVPAGAIQTGAFFNGSSSARADGKEYVGRYSCRISWRKY
jgi:hypothetical protein